MTPFPSPSPSPSLSLPPSLSRSKGPNKRHRDHLSVANGLLQTSPSSGYQTSEDEEEEGGLDVAESATVLELEEGITLGHQARIIAKKVVMTE